MRHSPHFHPQFSSLATILLFVASFGCDEPQKAKGVSPQSSAPVTTTEEPPRGTSPENRKPPAEQKGTVPEGREATEQKAEPAEETVGPEEKQRLTAYWEAMGKGRLATTKEKYADALEAFGQALVVMPDDARAYAERGYAQLLAKNYRLAREDFDAAVLRTDDRKLLAQIWFNYGLTAEAEGRAEDARSAFARSNEMNPTEAARAHIGDASKCTARVENEEPHGGHYKGRLPQKNVDWLGMFDLMSENSDATRRPKTADEARNFLCLSGDCQLSVGGAAPLHYKLPKETSYGVAIQTEEGNLRPFHRLMTVESGSCGLESKAEFLHEHPYHFHVEATQMIESFRAPDGQECDSESADSCKRQCRPGTTVVQDFLFNPSGTMVPLMVQQWNPPGSKSVWEVSISGTDARIQSTECDFTWSLK